MLVIHNQLKRVGKDLFQGNNWLNCVSRANILPIFSIIFLTDLVDVSDCIDQFVELVITQFSEWRWVLDDDFDLAKTSVELDVLLVLA